MSMMRVWSKLGVRKVTHNNSSSWSDDYLRIVSWTCRVHDRPRMGSARHSALDAIMQSLFRICHAAREVSFRFVLCVDNASSKYVHYTRQNESLIKARKTI